jgi:uncharacterized membrane protein YccF (DUF307 family)
VSLGDLAGAGMDRLAALETGETVIRAILNVIWLVFCGLWMAIGYAVAGLVCFVLIITIPFGIAAFRIAACVVRWAHFRRQTTGTRAPHVGALSLFTARTAESPATLVFLYTIWVGLI